MSTALILGAAVWQNGPSPTLRRRCACAAGLFHDGTVTRLIACGGMGQYPPSEADAIRALLLGHAVPDSAISLEDRSTNTGENIRNALPLLDTREVIVVTDWFHAPRARLVARREGLSVRSASPPLKGTKLAAQTRGALREIPAYLVYLLRIGR